MSFDLLRYIDYSDSELVSVLALAFMFCSYNVLEKFVIWSFIYKTRIPVSPVTYHKFQNCLRSFFLSVVRSIAIYWWFSLWIGIGPSSGFDAMEVPYSVHRTFLKSLSSDLASISHAYPFHLSRTIYFFIDLGRFFMSFVRSIATFKRFRLRICVCLSSVFDGMEVPYSEASIPNLVKESQIHNDYLTEIVPDISTTRLSCMNS